MPHRLQLTHGSFKTTATKPYNHLPQIMKALPLGKNRTEMYKARLNLCPKNKEYLACI